MAVKGRKAVKPAPKAKSKRLNAKKDFDEPIKKEPEQMSMEAPTPDPPKSLIMNGKVQAEFVRPRFQKEKDEHITGLEFSLSLSSDHEGHVPAPVIRHWQHMKDGGVKRQDLTDIDPQTIDVYMVPDGNGEGSELHLTAAKISRARIEEVVKTGDGREERYFRFNFCALTPQTKNIVTFAAWKHGEACWLQLRETQGTLV